MTDAAVDGPGLSPAVLATLADPPADGMLLVRTTPSARNAGLREGDVLVGLGGLPTTDGPAFVAACDRVGTGTVVHEVQRGGDRLAVPADRSCLAHAEPVPVRAGVPISDRPPATHELDVRWFAGTMDLHAERAPDASATPAGVRSRRGFEHHALSIEGSTLELVSEIAFAHRSDVFTTSAKSALSTMPTLRLAELRWRDPVRSAEVTGAVMARRVALEASSPAGRVTVTHPLVPDLVPSLLVAFAGCLLPREAGAAAHVSPLPEDLFPWWSGGGGQASFPLDGLRLPKTVVCAGRSTVRVRREEVEAWRFDAIALDRSFGTTWLDDDGQVVAVDLGGFRLLPADPAIVRAGLQDLRA